MSVKIDRIAKNKRPSFRPMTLVQHIHTKNIFLVLGESIDPDRFKGLRFGESGKSEEYQLDVFIKKAAFETFDGSVTISND